MTSTKSYQYVLPQVFPRTSDVIRDFHTLSPTFCRNSQHYYPPYVILTAHIPHCMEYEKALVSSYCHNNDRLERYE